MELAAAKSWVGHGETAAGAIGLLRAAGRLQQMERFAILHLSQLNAYVAGALEDSSTPFAAGRQSSPGVSSWVQGAATVGVSAFAFQGTNAHAVLSTSTSTLPAAAYPAPSVATELGWHRRRMWFVPPVHQLLLRLLASGGGQVAFDMALGRPTLAYLWHHPVSACCCWAAPPTACMQLLGAGT